MAGGATILIAGTAYGIHARGGPGITFSTADNFTLNRGNGAEPDTLDPHKASGVWENNIIGDMFMGLMTDAADSSPMPGAAESMTRSADGLTYTFKIRDHLWSDGKPVTAHDYVFSLRRMADPKTAAQYVSILYPIKNMQAAAAGQVPSKDIGVRAIDDRTLEIRFNYQVPYIRELLLHYTTFAVPQHVVEKYGDDWTKPGNIAVNGPYLLKEWVSNDHVRLEKNPRFVEASGVKIRHVYYYPTQDASASLKRFRAGEFDLVTSSVPPQQVDWLRTHMPREMRISPFILSQYVQFNLHRKPFDDLRVRQAISLAIDRERLVKQVMRAGELPAYSLVPPGLPGYKVATVGFEAMPMDARLDKARSLLADAGYGLNNPLTFAFNTSNTTEARIVSVALQGMWNEIGAKTQIFPSESQIHYSLLRKRDFQAGWGGWAADYRDAKNFLMLFQRASTDLNYGDYSDARYEALIDKSDNTGDPVARAVLLREAEQIVLDAVALSPVYIGVTNNLVSPQVKNWIPNNENVNRTRFLSLDRTNLTA
ncbi:MAG TPA: peptide ABC transporter substrate-binding protein [Rhizomicrobium sp.]|nr:peptide ABC transporter substrate-binding protein [Rhizomicrobium sp.]